ncbi:MAG: hypothetical protein U5L96_21320 [Owenweeksia sp.]|nr:hypothetical protein [Owenweeksia sp.]
MVNYIEDSDRINYQGQNLILIGHSRGGTDAILYAPTDGRISKLITWAAASEAETPGGNRALKR